MREQVRASFLQPHGINHTVVRVPPLEDAELAEVEAAYPTLAVPLKSQALRNILRNPFVLDKALDIPWSSEKSLPQTEREFRALFWREIVRGGHRVGPAMRRLREEALQIIAVRQRFRSRPSTVRYYVIRGCGFRWLQAVGCQLRAMRC